MSTHYWRNFYYYMGWDYDSENDKPTEESVKKKQVLMKQVGLSKLKMNKVRIEPKVPFDLQKIKTNDKEEKESKTKTPAPSPINMSQKQQQHKTTYSDKLKLLKNI